MNKFLSEGQLAKLAENFYVDIDESEYRNEDCNDLSDTVTKRTQQS